MMYAKNAMELYGTPTDTTRNTTEHSIPLVEPCRRSRTNDAHHKNTIEHHGTMTNALSIVHAAE